MKKTQYQHFNTHLTKVRLIGAAFKTNSFLCALYQEVSHQLIGHVSYCRNTQSKLHYIHIGK